MKDALRRLPLLLALATGSCSDPTAPGRDVTVEFCFPPMWAAYRNEDGPWRRLDLPVGVVRLTDHVAIATVRPGLPPSTILEVQFLSADQVEVAYACPQNPPGSTRFVSATIAGVEATDELYAVLGTSIAYRYGAGLLNFPGVPNGSWDLVAARRIVEPTRLRVPGVIVRRAPDLSFNALLELVDFSSAEAVAPVPHTITFTETAPATSIGFQIDFTTSKSTWVPISGGITGATATGYSLPASILVPSDLHLLNASAFVPGQQRSFLFLYAGGADRTFSFGPSPNAPVFTAPAAGTVVRASLVSQPEFDAQVSLRLDTEGHSVTLEATREYFNGTPPTWTLDVPDFQGVAGFQESWRFPDQSFDWTLIVTGQPWRLNPGNAKAGDLFRTAHLSGSR
jgi:hypothetical protein